MSSGVQVQGMVPVKMPAAAQIAAPIASQADTPSVSYLDNRTPYLMAVSSRAVLAGVTPALLQNSNPLVVAAALLRLVDPSAREGNLQGDWSTPPVMLENVFAEVINVLERHSLPSLQGMALRAAMVLSPEYAMPQAVALIKNPTAPDVLREAAIRAVSSVVTTSSNHVLANAWFEAASAIADLLNSKNDTLKIAALEALPKLGATGLSVLPMVVEMVLKNGNERVSAVALESIRSLASITKNHSLNPAVSARLRSVLLDADFKPWSAAMKVAEALGESAIPLLKNVVTFTPEFDPDMEMDNDERAMSQRQHDALVALVSMGNVAAPVVAELLSDATMRARVVGVVGVHHNNPGSVPLLLALSESAEEAPRKLAFKQLESYINAPAVQPDAKVIIAIHMLGRMENAIGPVQNTAIHIVDTVAVEHVDWMASMLLNDLAHDDVAINERAWTGLVYLGARALPYLRQKLSLVSRPGSSLSSAYIADLKQITEGIHEAMLRDISRSMDHPKGDIAAYLRMLSPEQIESLVLERGDAYVRPAVAVLQEMGQAGADTLVKLSANPTLAQTMRPVFDRALDVTTSAAIRAWEAGSMGAVRGLGSHERNPWNRPIDVLRTAK